MHREQDNASAGAEPSSYNFECSKTTLANLTDPASYQDCETLPARVVGVLRSPRALFAALIDRPRWADVMLASFVVTAACGAAFMATTVGEQALVDQWERTALAFGQEVGDEQYSELVALSEHGAFYAVMNALIRGPLLSCAVAAVIFGVFTGIRGAPGVRYTHVLAVAAHAGVVLALAQLVAAPFNYLRETLASPTTLGQLLPLFDEVSPAARFLGAIDLFVVWWVVVLAIGVSLLYRRSTRATASAFMGVYVGFAALLAISMAVAGGAL
jgi:hypothetical protein